MYIVIFCHYIAPFFCRLCMSSVSAIHNTTKLMRPSSSHTRPLVLTSNASETDSGVIPRSASSAIVIQFSRVNEQSFNTALISSCRISRKMICTPRPAEPVLAKLNPDLSGKWLFIKPQKGAKV